MDGHHQVGCGPREAVARVLAACDWQSKTAFLARLTLDMRQRVAAIGRRVNTLCQDENGLQHQLAVCHAYHHFVLPQASVRQPMRRPEPTNGTGPAKRWQPCTPAMAAGWTDHGWTLPEVLRYRVPPWPQHSVV